MEAPVLDIIKTPCPSAVFSHLITSVVTTFSVLAPEI